MGLAASCVSEIQAQWRVLSRLVRVVCVCEDSVHMLWKDMGPLHTMVREDRELVVVVKCTEFVALWR